MLRFIPAYAGNSLSSQDYETATAVHPRLRGELSESVSGRHCRVGSSPLTRGTHQMESQAQKDIRFIPAYAGNSTRSEMKFDAYSVHPRLRGELVKSIGVTDACLGSSPLTRGTLFCLHDDEVKRRFIPAYAGNSWTARKS